VELHPRDSGVGVEDDIEQQVRTFVDAESDCCPGQEAGH
jgi:hypothetical protein